MSRYYSQGEGTQKVPMDLFALNRKRLVESLKKLPNLPSHSAVVLQGGEDIHRDSTDVVNLFRQVYIIFMLNFYMGVNYLKFTHRSLSSNGPLEF